MQKIIAALILGLLNASGFECSSAFYLQWTGNTGRIQDEEPTSMNPVDSIIKYHDRCIPYLIGKITDTSDGPMAKPCCFSRDTKGQISLLYLVDLFTKSDEVTPSIDAFSIRNLTGITEAGVLPRNEKLSRFRHLRNKNSIKRKLAAAYAKHKDKLVFDEKENCFVLKAE